MVCFAARRFFLSRPEPGVICMAEGDFARVVATKRGESEKERRNEDETIL
jgi:hypothetical protein